MKILLKINIWLLLFSTSIIAQNNNYETLAKKSEGEGVVAISEQILNILPLGNSITQSKIPYYSYRYNLWKKMVDSGIKFDFVGSLDSNYTGVPAWPSYRGFQFDPDHEGHWGWRADELLDSLPVWLTRYTPNLVLMHVGSNDCNQGNSTISTVNELTQIINVLRGDNNKISILLAKLIPWDNTTVNSRINDLNSRFDSLASELTNDSSKIIVVDQNTGFDAVNDTFDGVHPNESGEEKMASVWFTGIKTILPNLNVNLFLEGAYISSNSMDTSLRTKPSFPLENPFNNSPWSYNGTEKVTSVPTDVVDWILISLRSGMSSSTTVARRSAFINSNGNIVDLDGSSPISIYAERGNYFIVVEHKNHLSIMSSSTKFVE